MIKNLRNSMVILFLLTFLFSCDKGFEDTNTSVDFVSSPNVDFELPYVELTMIDRNYYTHGYVVGPFVGHINNRASFPSVTLIVMIILLNIGNGYTSNRLRP